ncbi:hypothetical protein Sste5346_002203 [Sporothrix stenoceras]|uniref:Asteroid domain-containing protein n=1 Tax=Sporothrix stenoceras TaxID=5173 RepID=A0ABR3ZIF4_9PEZI
MGVPKLLTTLTPFGDRKPLDNANVIIDGPALAYHVVGLCMADPVMAATRSHPLEQPTYAQLGQAAMDWLDALCKHHNVEVQALYFDGYLPEAKRPVRLERSYRTSAQLKDVFSFYQRDNLPAFDVKGPRTGSLLPAPAFAVPAVLDALRKSRSYGTVTNIVPGEADTFCAWRAREDGHGTILTSDSDLLVQDLGPNAEVVLFRDIDLPKGEEAGDTKAAKKKLVVPTYKMATICQRLGLPVPEYHFLDSNETTCKRHMKSGKGLYGFAFELSMDPHLGTSELVDRTKQGLAMAKYPQEYIEFVEQYAFPEEFVAAVRFYHFNDLDPRVAEVAFQSVSSGTHPDSKKIEVKTLPILTFAPPLVDSCTRTNAWEISAPIRTLAYSLVQTLPAAQNMGETVREYSRMASMASRGLELELIPVEDLLKALDGFMFLVRLVRNAAPTTSGSNNELQWITLASYYDVLWSKENSKDSACLEVLRQETPSTGVLERVTWTAMHWLAQIQGTLYSLRILKQLVLFVQAEGECWVDSTSHKTQLAAKLESLEEILDTVTPLSAYPTLRTLRDLPSRLKTTDALELLATLAELPEPISFKPAPGSKKNKNRNRKRKRTGEAPPRVQTMTNPFAILDGAD